MCFKLQNAYKAIFYFVPMGKVIVWKVILLQLQRRPTDLYT